MADKQFTLLELHLHDGISLSATKLLGDEEASGSDDISQGETADAPIQSDRTCLARKAGRLFLALALIAAVVAVTRRLASGDDELEALADLDEDEQ